MTLDELKKYLTSIPTGVENPAIGGIATTVIEAGYASVWGANNWKVKRAENTTLATVANQVYTSLPADFESLISLKVIDGTASRSIDIVDENSFDYDIPSPVAWQVAMPRLAKVVFADPLYRAVWYPVPDAVYTVHLVYVRRADSAKFPNLPSYMQDAVISKASSMMLRGEDRTAAETVAMATLNRAILSDGAVSGYSPRVGGDPGWDDYAMGPSGGSSWDPFSVP
jgi:hypothetical protein